MFSHKPFFSTFVKLVFFCMNREKSVLRTRLGKDTLDHIMYINIDGPSSDNFDTEKCFGLDLIRRCF